MISKEPRVDGTQAEMTFSETLTLAVLNAARLSKKEGGPVRIEVTLGGFATGLRITVEQDKVTRHRPGDRE